MLIYVHDVSPRFGAPYATDKRVCAQIRDLCPDTSNLLCVRVSVNAVNACMCAGVHMKVLCVCVCMYTYICIYIYVYTYMYIYTCIQYTHDVLPRFAEPLVAECRECVHIWCVCDVCAHAHICDILVCICMCAYVYTHTYIKYIHYVSPRFPVPLAAEWRECVHIRRARDVCMHAHICVCVCVCVYIHTHS